MEKGTQSAEGGCKGIRCQAHPGRGFVSAGIHGEQSDPAVAGFDRGKFGPFAGQLLVGEMNRSRIVRVMLDEVAGELQGACVPFYDDAGLTRGSHRFVFGEDGSLWVGQTHLSWVGGEGVQRIRWNGKTPMDVQSMKLIPGGFKIHIHQALGQVHSCARPVPFQTLLLCVPAGYGSPQHGTEAVKVAGSKRLRR